MGMPKTNISARRVSTTKQGGAVGLDRGKHENDRLERFTLYYEPGEGFRKNPRFPYVPMQTNVKQ